MRDVVAGLHRGRSPVAQAYSRLMAQPVRLPGRTENARTQHSQDNWEM